MTKLSRARLFLAGLALVAAGLALSPLAWLALVVPGGLLLAAALLTKPEPESET